MKAPLAIAVLFSSALLVSAQQSSLKPAGTWVQQVPSRPMPVKRGRPQTVQLEFSVQSGYHINSSKPNSDYLIPTMLKLDPPTDIVVGRVTYPPGQNMSFAFDPSNKLNVYTGEFAVRVQVHSLATVVPGKYMIRGDLKYQACDDRACYPPKHLPVDFEVDVKRAAVPHRVRNPKQSPNVHQ